MPNHEPERQTSCTSVLRTSRLAPRITSYSWQVEALEDAMPDRPGIVVSLCRTMIETTSQDNPNGSRNCSRLFMGGTEVSFREHKYLNLGSKRWSGGRSRQCDPASMAADRSHSWALNQIITRHCSQIRNVTVSAAHGADAYLAYVLDARYARKLRHACATDAVHRSPFQKIMN